MSATRFPIRFRVVNGTLIHAGEVKHGGNVVVSACGHVAQSPCKIIEYAVGDKPTCGACLEALSR